MARPEPEHRSCSSVLSRNAARSLVTGLSVRAARSMFSARSRCAAVRYMAASVAHPASDRERGLPRRQPGPQLRDAVVARPPARRLLTHDRVGPALAAFLHPAGHLEPLLGRPVRTVTVERALAIVGHPSSVARSTPTQRDPRTRT